MTGRTLPGFNPSGLGIAGANPFLGGSFNPYTGSLGNPYGLGGYGGGNRGYGGNSTGYSGSGGYGGNGAGYSGSGGYGDNSGTSGYGGYPAYGNGYGSYEGSAGYGSNGTGSGRPRSYEDSSGSGGYNSKPADQTRTGSTGAADMSASAMDGPRVRALQVALDRARRDPSLSEIASGRPLNVLLANASAQLARGRRGPDVPLNDEVLARINVSAKPEGDIGLLRDDGRLKWPASLQGAAFAEVRTQMNVLMAEAVRQARSGEPVTAAVLEELGAGLQQLKDAVRGHIGEMSPAEYVEAVRYLSGLSECVKALGDPKVSNYFDKTWSARGRTVAELVQNMAGLYFAPAVPGDEIAYRALHRALVTFDAGLTAADAK
jgi:hypothetical protein